MMTHVRQLDCEAGKKLKYCVPEKAEQLEIYSAAKQLIVD
jgi:hypothetical protein